MISFWIVFLAGIGFGISYYISYKKSQKQPLVCLVGMDCNKVVTGEYANLFGIPNEMMGMMYYGSLILAFFAANGGGLGDVFGVPFTSLVFTASVAALFVSLVLTYIQGFVIKHWCSWCLASAGVNVLLVLTEWLTMP
jgi:uncharacterized membrane protein